MILDGRLPACYLPVVAGWSTHRPAAKPGVFAHCRAIFIKHTSLPRTSQERATDLSVFSAFNPPAR